MMSLHMQPAAKLVSKDQVMDVQATEWCGRGYKIIHSWL